MKSVARYLNKTIKARLQALREIAQLVGHNLAIFGEFRFLIRTIRTVQ